MMESLRINTKFLIMWLYIYLSPYLKAAALLPYGKGQMTIIMYQILLYYLLPSDLKEHGEKETFMDDDEKKFFSWGLPSFSQLPKS